MIRKYYNEQGPDENSGGTYSAAISPETEKDILNKLSRQPDDDNTGGLGKVDTAFDIKTKNDQENIKIAMEIGYRGLGLDILPSKGNYYPSDCQLSIRAADVSEIKHFSSMNEEDYIDAEDKIAYVLEKCCKLVWGGSVRSSIYLKDADKLYLLFTIRDLTMHAQGKENKIMMSPQCPHCGEIKKMELVNNVFGFYDVPVGIQKYYSEEMRCFVIPLENENLKVFVPNIGVTSWIKKYVVEKETRKARNQDNSFYNTQTLQFMQFLVESPTGCSENLVNSISKKIAEEWSLEKMEVMQYISDNLTSAIKPTILTQCITEEGGGCKKEFSAPITFRKGLRYLFSVTGVTTKLFGDTP